MLGPRARDRLRAAAEAVEPGAGRKLDRAPTLVTVTARQGGDAIRNREDLLATGVAAYLVLLAAHDRGLAGYWRTLALLRDPAGRAVVGIREDEELVALLYLGHPRQPPPVPERAPVAVCV